MQEGRLTDLLQQLGPTQMQSTHSALAGALSFLFALRWIRIRMSRCGSQSQPVQCCHEVAVGLNLSISNSGVSLRPGLTTKLCAALIERPSEAMHEAFSIVVSFFAQALALPVTTGPRTSLSRIHAPAASSTTPSTWFHFRCWTAWWSEPNNLGSLLSRSSVQRLRRLR